MATFALLAVVGLLLVAYLYGFSAGRDEGWNEGKDLGKREGAQRGFAVGYDRGKREQTEEKSADPPPADESPSLWPTVVIVAILTIVVLSLVAMVRRN